MESVFIGVHPWFKNMADVFTKAKRSEVMSRIRGRGNKDTELALAKIFRAQRITGWRRQAEIRGRAVASVYDRRKAGARRAPLQKPFRVKPDFVFIKLKLAIFVDGCFWHGCPKHCSPMKWLRKSSMPANNPPLPSRLRRTGRAFWRRKLSANKARDRVVARMLRRAGWRVLRVWEHELARRNQPRLLGRIQRALNQV